LIAADSLRSRAEWYRSIGAECNDENLATEVEILVRELNAAARSLERLRRWMLKNSRRPQLAAPSSGPMLAARNTAGVSGRGAATRRVPQMAKKVTRTYRGVGSNRRSPQVREIRPSAPYPIWCVLIKLARLSEQGHPGSCPPPG
jgi:hypothetical protein